jgi:hypothetical protein
MSEEGYVRRPSWFVLAVLTLISVSLATLGLLVFIFPIEPGIFEAFTGETWAAFSSSAPGVATYLELATRLLGMATMGIGLLGVAVVWYGIRDGSRIAVKTMWTVPVVLSGAAVAWFLSGDLVVAGVCTGVAALVAFALVGARRSVA